MRKTKRLAAAFCALALCVLAGCGAQKAEYPPLESVDIASQELLEVRGAAFKCSAPADKWLAVDGGDPLAVVYEETSGTDRAVNINVQQSVESRSDPTENDMKSLLDTLEGQYGFPIETAELRTLDGRTVIYTEYIFKMADKYIDLMLEQGAWTEEWIESVGGREVLMSIPEAQQIGIYAVADGVSYIYTGTYYDETQKADVLTAMTVMIQTTEKI